MKIAQQIIKLIESSIEDFNGSIPGLERQLYKDLVKELQKLNTNEGKILADVNNLKLIGGIRNKLEKIILNEAYLGKVQTYVQAFDLVTALQVQYFQDFNKDFKPAKTLKIVRELAVDATLNSLTESGINANVLDPVHELLRINITSGGDFPDLLEALQNKLVSSDKDLGSLQKYTKQITTDALNTYSANYQKSVSEDLGLEWHRYVGSNITTTREFCEFLTKKDYVHQSELPAIIKGLIDGHQCLIYKKTGLPYGMKPETNVSNFQSLRGGYTCGHQFFAVPTSAVPENVKDSLGKAPEIKVETKPEDIKFFDLEKLKDYPVKIDNKTFTLLKKQTDIEFGPDRSYYLPVANKIVIGKGTRFTNSPLQQEKVMYHEVAHAVHYQNDIITSNKVSPEFADLFKSLQKSVSDGKAQEIFDSYYPDTIKIYNGDDQLAKEKYGYENRHDFLESSGVVSDILGSLTKGKVGHGHTKKYYKTYNGAEAEIFAHGSYHYFKDDKLMNKVIPGISIEMKKYFTKLYSDESK